MQFSKLSVFTVLAMASSAQAQQKYAGYIPRTDANAYWTKDVEQKDFEDLMSDESCPSVLDARDEWVSPNDPTKMAGYLKSIPTIPAPISKEWNEYIKYYGTPTFHIEWVTAAFECDSITNWDCDLFEPDFNTAYCGGTSTYGSGIVGTEVVAGKECVGIEESAKKATSYVYQFIEAVQLMAKAIQLTKGGCNPQFDTLNNLPVCEDAIELWDAAAATFTGSLEGEEGALPGLSNDPNPDNRAYGKSLYTLAEKRCRNFMTCGPKNGDGVGPSISPDRYATASINSKIMQFFAAGSHAAYSGDSRRMEYFKRKISAKMMVPWVQGTLRYTHRMSDSRSTQCRASQTHKEIGEASTFALGALPKLWACSVAAANAVEPLVRTGNSFGVGNEISFIVVKNAFECNYRCLGITCEEVGELFDGDDDVKPDADACKDKDNLSGDLEVAKCAKPNSKYNKKCRNYIGKSGISKRANLEYFVQGL